jgi:hypothetical protein
VVVIAATTIMCTPNTLTSMVVVVVAAVTITRTPSTLTSTPTAMEETAATSAAALQILVVWPSTLLW